jgi:hypothetical protein
MGIIAEYAEYVSQQEKKAGTSRLLPRSGQSIIFPADTW